MYKTSGKFSQRNTRSDATIVINDRVPMKMNLKEYKPMPRLLRGDERADISAILDHLQLQPELFPEYGGPEGLFRCYKIIKDLDHKQIRHWRAVSQYLEKAGFRGSSGTAFSAGELQKVIQLINKKFRTKRRSRKQQRSKGR